MILDIIGLSLLLIAFIKGFNKGIIKAVLYVLGTLLGTLFALKLAHKVSGYLFDNHIFSSAWTPLLSYLLLFIGVVWVVRLIAKIATKTTEKIYLGWLEKTIGGILYMLLTAIIWGSILWLLSKGHILSLDLQNESKTCTFFLQLSQWTFEHLGSIIPFAKDSFAQLNHLFDQINNTLPDHVGTPR